jgi:hypothetical protein
MPPCTVQDHTSLPASGKITALPKSVIGHLTSIYVSNANGFQLLEAQWFEFEATP